MVYPNPASVSARLLVLVSLTVAVPGLADESDKSPTFPGVLPRPREYREAATPRLLAPPGQSVRIRVFGNHPALQTGRQELIEALRRLGAAGEPGEDGAAIRIGAAADWPAAGAAALPGVPDKPEGYSLVVPEKPKSAGVEVVVRGSDPMGAYYGVQTLIQLLDRSPDGVTVRPATVRDWPTFSFRMFKGQCWYYRDNRMFVQWAPRFKWNVFGSCYTDSPDWRNPSESYRTMVADLCDTARRRGNIRAIQLGNPFMIKEKAIRATSDGDVEILADFFELSLSRGADAIMLCLDDFAYLPEEDAKKFTSLAGANISIATRFAERVWSKHPGTRILLCPPPYWLNANRAANYSWAHEYLREFCARIPGPIEIVWTGSAVTTVRHEAADIEAYQKLVGPNRKLFLWDNTLKMPPGWGNVFRMNAMLETCKDLATSAWPRMAGFTHGGAGINTYGPGEIYKVPLMTAADYLWNPESYEPADSLHRALYWFDDDHAVGPMVYHWINGLHQDLFDKRLAFLKAPSQQGLDEIKTLTAEYQSLFERIAGRTANGTLVATLEPYRRRHVDALDLLANVLAAWQVRTSSSAEAVRKLDLAAEKATKLADELRKGDLDGDRHGLVKQELEDRTGKAIAALRGTVSTRPAGEPRADLLDDSLREPLRTYLEDICQWILTLDAGSGTLKNTKDTATSIFINGNFARCLMAAHRITGKTAYRDEALRWCDTFYAQQQLALTSALQEGGFWFDVGYGKNIYFGDGGTAATALAMGYRIADEQRKAVYLKAMERYARFVTQGTVVDPQGLGRESTRSWVITSGDDRGALGCGYYLGHLSTAPYTIATANTGASFFSELFAITGNEQYREIAAGAARWIVKARKDDGEIPYILDGKTETTWPLDTLSYCAEGLVAADLRLKEPALHDLLARELKPTVRRFLARQNADGSWGELRSADQQRSPRAVVLLSWYYRRVEADPRIAESVRRYCEFLLKPEQSRAYGVKDLVRTTGFVGLTVAELLQPESTF